MTILGEKDEIGQGGFYYVCKRLDSIYTLMLIQLTPR